KMRFRESFTPVVFFRAVAPKISPSPSIRESATALAIPAVFVEVPLSLFWRKPICSACRNLEANVGASGLRWQFASRNAVLGAHQVSNRDNAVPRQDIHPRVAHL